MQTITKRIVGITQILLLVFLGCGLCMAEELLALDEAIPIAPYGVIDTATPTYEWTSVPGATIYCLLVENIDGVPLYLAWYTDEEAECMNGEEYCSVTPEYPVDEGSWSVLPCSGDQCGRWTEPAPAEYAYNRDIRTEVARTPWHDCEAQCHQQKIACDKGCSKGNTKYNQTWCSRVCTVAVNMCMKKCGPKPCIAFLEECFDNPPCPSGQYYGENHQRDPSKCADDIYHRLRACCARYPQCASQGTKCQAQ